MHPNCVAQTFLDQPVNLESLSKTSSNVDNHFLAAIGCLQSIPHIALEVCLKESLFNQLLEATLLWQAQVPEFELENQLKEHHYCKLQKFETDTFWDLSPFAGF